MTSKGNKNANDIDVQKLLEILPKLIRENDTVKGAIITALSGVMPTKDDFNALIAEMDKRFEAMDKRFEALQEQMNKRFEAIQQQMDKRFDAMQRQMDIMQSTLEDIKESFGVPFEQFARNVVSRILEGEGFPGVELTQARFKDPEGEVFPETKEVEIDGLSDDPPVIIEITTILRSRDKVDKFLAKKSFIEKEKGHTYRGFFVASGTQLSQHEQANIVVLLKNNGAELLNL